MLLTVLINSTLLVACSQESGSSASASSAPLTPELQHADPAPSTDVMKANLTAAGANAEYDAHFSGERLVRIEEVRAAARGDYAYEGARLISYSGATLDNEPNVELRFDAQGRALTARVGDREASEAEISAIRERSQLLRSHALAAHAARKHRAEH